MLSGKQTDELRANHPDLSAEDFDRLLDWIATVRTENTIVESVLLGNIRATKVDPEGRNHSFKLTNQGKSEVSKLLMTATITAINTPQDTN